MPYITNSFDNPSEDFWLQVSTNGGSSYVTKEEWNLGDEFVNGVREFETVTIPGPFSSNTKIRFRSDASSAYDWLYIDDILLEANCDGANQTNTQNLAILNEYKTQAGFDLAKNDLTLFPNPASDNLTVVTNIPEEDIGYLILINISGQTILERAVSNGKQEMNIDLSSHDAGYYLMILKTNQDILTEKLVITNK